MLLFPASAADGFPRNNPFRVPAIRYLVFAAVFIMVMGGGTAWAIQHHSLEADSHGAEHAVATHESVQTEMHASDEGAAAAVHETDHSVPAHDTGHGDTQAVEDTGHGDTHAAPAAHGDEQSEHAAADHGAGGHDEHGGHHGPALPEISPIPGVTFVEVLINLMDNELNGRLFGWRPNDITVGQITDDVNEFQLGVLEAVRHATRLLKEDLSRLGEADAYDRDLEAALNLLMNKATLFWFPSAENSYNEALDHLRNFKRKLETGERSFFYRTDSVKKICAIFEDFLGNVNKDLIRSGVSWFKVDNSFYYAKGASHVIYELMRVVRVGFEYQLQVMDAADFLDVILHELYVVENLHPWIILDGALDGWVANHRANLNAPLSEATHLFGIVSRLQ